MTFTAKPFCSKNLHPRTLEFGWRDKDSRWTCRPCHAANQRVRTKAKPKPPAEFCAICGLKLEQHPKCRVCSILCSPGHLEPRLVAGICGSCARRARARLERTA